jgi:hypothetical protein
LTVAATPRRLTLANGTWLVVAFVAIFALGWFLYRTTIPPTWLRNFGEAIAVSARPDPNAPLPEDSRQETPRDPTASPYICGARAISRAWDRLVVVPSGADAREQPVLAAAEWPKNDPLARYAEKLRHDPRYQGLVLLDHGKVVADAIFFTFWADLSALARPEGFTPADAIFTAKVANGTYVLSVANDVPADICAP